MQRAALESIRSVTRLRVITIQPPEVRARSFRVEMMLPARRLITPYVHVPKPRR